MLLIGVALAASVPREAELFTSLAVNTPTPPLPWTMPSVCQSVCLCVSVGVCVCVCMSVSVSPALSFFLDRLHIECLYLFVARQKPDVPKICMSNTDLKKISFTFNLSTFGTFCDR